MSFARLLGVGPLLVVLPSCGASIRTGPKFSVTAAEPALQGEVTLAGGPSDTDGDALGQFVVPITFAAGSTLDHGDGLVHLESGMEYATVPRDGRFGYRMGARLGGVLSGPGGFFLGLRGGPTLSLEPSQESDQRITMLGLEGFASVTTGGELAGKPTLGLALMIGWDEYGSFNIPSGRPLRGADDALVVAEPRSGTSWRESVVVADLEALSVEERVTLGGAWVHAATMEHASIASFARLALDLMALGAPSDLVERAHRAALDETRHARLCFGLASAYLGRDIEPGDLPLAEAAGSTSLIELATASFVDGAWGEGLAASVARARARRARTPTVKRILTRIARDEARHAELGWDIVSWCAGRNPSSLERIERAWARAASNETSAGSDARLDSKMLRDHGLADPELVHTALIRTRSAVERRLRALASSPWRVADA